MRNATNKSRSIYTKSKCYAGGRDRRPPGDDTAESKCTLDTLDFSSLACARSVVLQAIVISLDANIQLANMTFSVSQQLAV